MWRWQILRLHVTNSTQTESVMTGIHAQKNNTNYYLNSTVYSFTRPTSKQSAIVQYLFLILHHAMNADLHKRVQLSKQYPTIIRNLSISRCKVGPKPLNFHISLATSNLAVYMDVLSAFQLNFLNFIRWYVTLTTDNFIQVWFLLFAAKQSSR